ncbi:hypothetical protein JXO59_12435 [candidate division KSB1 bacterium]|nr:hypothetical protein [candidate division KSB1 bacterium]
MKKHTSNVVIGAILIVIGLGLILKRMDILSFGWDELYPLVLILLGGMSALSVIKGDKSASFWSAFLLLCGFATFFRNYGIIDAFWTLELWTIVVLAFGISFFVLYFFKPQDWGILVPGAIVTFFGLIFLFDDLNVSWMTLENMRDYWPVILIIIGIGVVISALTRKSQ